MAADDDHGIRPQGGDSAGEPHHQPAAAAVDVPGEKKSAAVVDVEEARRDGDGGPAGGGDAVSVYSESSLVQAGVQKAMILKKAWSRTTLLIAFTRCVRSIPMLFLFVWLWSFCHYSVTTC